jgi:CHAT domain-containing protein
MSEQCRYCVDWAAGASVEIEFTSPTGANRFIQIRYTPAFRRSIRPPILITNAGDATIEPVFRKFNELVNEMEGDLRGEPEAGNKRPSPEVAPGQSIAKMDVIGSKFYTFLLPNYVKADLRSAKDLFLEIGMDSKLINYPLELMRDNEDYLCLKHRLGRYLISPNMQAVKQPAVGIEFEKISVLLISVPNPENRKNGESYEVLSQAKAETEAICNSLGAMQGKVKFEILLGEKATSDNVYTALNNGNYHILHFNGHAYFDEKEPSKSKLVLFDEDMDTGQILQLIEQKPPILCFINACETARTNGEGEKRRGSASMYGLATAFLETGAYLLGSRWKVEDSIAKKFAETFYDALLKDEKTIGQAIVDGRKTCRTSFPNDEFGWATYVYYGDPRVYFRKIKD